MQKIIATFKTLADVNKMDRCHEFLDTNANESIHGRLHQIINKTHHYSIEHVMFACETSIMIHNFGHLQGSLLNHLKCLNPEEEKHLRILDNAMRRKAETRNPLKPIYEQTYEGPIHYQSGYGFEDNPPIYSYDDDPDDPEPSDHN